MKVKAFKNVSLVNLAVPLLLLLLILGNLGFYRYANSYCSANFPAKNVRGGLPILDEAKVQPGYLLISPYDAKQITDATQGTVYLVDMYGKPVHTWQTKFAPLYSQLKEDGHLIVALITPDNFNKNGKTGLLQELDWDGNVVWQYRNENLHHDFTLLPNGNIGALVFEPVAKDVAEKVKGGVPNTTPPSGMLGDVIVEIDKSGNKVWEWHATDHLNFEEDVLGPLTPRVNLTHANSLRFIKNDPIKNGEAFLISFRHLSKIAFVEKSSGEILWKSPEGLVNSQHDASYLEDGNLLIFNNGTSRIFQPNVPLYGSVVMEYSIKEKKVVWSFDGGETGTAKARFFDAITSGAQRLPNGNTLITEGPSGHIFEVTPDKEVVWDMLSPYAADEGGFMLNNAFFKVKKYTDADVHWPQKMASSKPSKVMVSYCFH